VLSVVGWTRPVGGAKIASAQTLRAKQVSAAIAAAAEAEANAPAAAAPAPAPAAPVAPAPPVEPPAAAPAPAPKTAQKPATSTAAQTFSIAIGGTGYEPSQVVAAAGRPITLKVAKGEGCAGGFLMPSLGVDKDNSGGPVSVKLGPLTAGSYQWTCGMGMVSGTLVVR
jgi:Cupredoxin-like domain